MTDLPFSDYEAWRIENAESRDEVRRDRNISPGSEGEPFMMLSCREAKQCLHNIPGCICDGDPTNG